jgi:hypothetical protein
LNMNGFRTRLPDLQALLHGRNPAFICVQETNLFPSHAASLHGYATHRYEQPSGERASGWTASLVKDCICCVPVNLHSPLQVIAVREHPPTLHFALCNTNLLPAVPVRQADRHSYRHRTFFSGILMRSVFFEMETSLTGEH